MPLYGIDYNWGPTFVIKKMSGFNGVEVECTYIFFIGSGSKTGYPKAPVLCYFVFNFFFSFWQINFYSFQEPVENKTVKGGVRIAEL